MIRGDVLRKLRVKLGSDGAVLSPSDDGTYALVEPCQDCKARRVLVRWVDKKSADGGIEHILDSGEVGCTLDTENLFDYPTPPAIPSAIAAEVSKKIAEIEPTDAYPRVTFIQFRDPVSGPSMLGGQMPFWSRSKHGKMVKILDMPAGGGVVLGWGDEVRIVFANNVVSVSEKKAT